MQELAQGRCNKQKRNACRLVSGRSKGGGSARTRPWRGRQQRRRGGSTRTRPSRRQPVDTPRGEKTQRRYSQQWRRRRTPEEAAAYTRLRGRQRHLIGQNQHQEDGGLGRRSTCPVGRPAAWQHARTRWPSHGADHKMHVRRRGERAPRRANAGASNNTHAEGQPTEAPRRPRSQPTAQRSTNNNTEGGGQVSVSTTTDDAATHTRVFKMVT